MHLVNDTKNFFYRSITKRLCIKRQGRARSRVCACLSVGWITERQVWGAPGEQTDMLTDMILSLCVGVYVALYTHRALGPMYVVWEDVRTTLCLHCSPYMVRSSYRSPHCSYYVIKN